MHAMANAGQESEILQQLSAWQSRQLMPPGGCVPSSSFLYLICSLGVNLGEAVNFAAPDWLRFGAAALARLRHFRQPCVVSQEELLLRVAVQQAGPAVTAALAHVSGKAGDAAAAAGQPAEGAVVASSPLVCYHLGRELERVVEEQWVLRAKLWSEGGQALRAVALHFCRHLLPGDLFQQLCWGRCCGLYASCSRRRRCGSAGSVSPIFLHLTAGDCMVLLLLRCLRSAALPAHRAAGWFPGGRAG
jgi:hypothetical protein